MYRPVFPFDCVTMHLDAAGPFFAQEAFTTPEDVGGPLLANGFAVEF